MAEEQTKAEALAADSVSQLGKFGLFIFVILSIIYFYFL